MVASKMAPPRGGKQAVRHFGAFQEPVPEHGPKLRDRNIGDGVRGKGVDPVLGDYFAPRLGPFCGRGEKTDETQTRWPRRSRSPFGMYRAACSRDRYRSHGNLRRGTAEPGPEPGAQLPNV